MYTAGMYKVLEWDVISSLFSGNIRKYIAMNIDIVKTNVSLFYRDRLWVEVPYAGQVHQGVIACKITIFFLYYSLLNGIVNPVFN